MNNDNLIPFKPKVTSKVTPSDHQTAVVELFERYLAAAKAGKIKFAAIATVDKNMVALTTWEPMLQEPAQTTAALGAVNFLNHRLAQACCEGGDYSDSLDIGPDVA